MRRNTGWRLFYWAIVFVIAIPTFFIFGFAIILYRDGLCLSGTFAQSGFRGWGAVFGGVPWVFVALALSALLSSLVFRILPWRGARDAAMEQREMSFGAAIWLRCLLLIVAFVVAATFSFWNVPAIACGSPDGLSQRGSGFSRVSMHRWSEVTKVVASCDLGRNRGAGMERPFFVVFTFVLRW